MIPREGVESLPRLVLGSREEVDVIPREGVESLPRLVLGSREEVDVIPREGVESEPTHAEAEMPTLTR